MAVLSASSLIITRRIWVLMFCLSASQVRVWHVCWPWAQKLTGSLCWPTSWVFSFLRCWKASRSWTTAFCWASTSWTIPLKTKKRSPYKMCPTQSGRGYRKSSTPRPWNPSRVQASLQMGSLRRIQTRKCSHAPILVSGTPVTEQVHTITFPGDGTLGIDSWLAANGLN